MIKRVSTLAPAAVSAVPIFVQDETLASVVEKSKTMYPKTIFKKIRKSQVSGLHGVVMSENIAYTGGSGRYSILGHLPDTRRQADLTAQRKPDGKKTEFLAQQLDQAIRTVKDDNSRVLAVFSDLDCPYCKQLESELARLDNVIIYTFLYLLEPLHLEVRTKATSAWCAPNRAKAWNELILAGRKPKLVAYDNPANDNLVLGSKLGVVDAPTLIAVDGHVLPGSAPAGKIDQRLNAGKLDAPATAQEATQ